MAKNLFERTLSILIVLIIQMQNAYNQNHLVLNKLCLNRSNPILISQCITWLCSSVNCRLFEQLKHTLHGEAWLVECRDSISKVQRLILSRFKSAQCGLLEAQICSPRILNPLGIGTWLGHVLGSSIWAHSHTPLRSAVVFISLYTVPRLPVD